jgi:transposase
MAWLTDVLERIVSRRTKWHVLHTLLPWNWQSMKTLTLNGQSVALAA